MTKSDDKSFLSLSSENTNSSADVLSQGFIILCLSAFSLFNIFLRHVLPNSPFDIMYMTDWSIHIQLTHCNYMWLSFTGLIKIPFSPYSQLKFV